MATQIEQEAFVWMQGRMVELLLRHDLQRFGTTFTERQAALFDDQRHTILHPYRELAVLMFLRNELFTSILPRIKRRLSFLAPREVVVEELPPRGRIDWPRTVTASLNTLPGEAPLEVQTRQRRRHFATPENLLTVATILEYRMVVQQRLDSEAASTNAEALSHPLQEIIDACTRELAFPQFTGLVRRCERIVDGYAEESSADLERAVEANLLPGRNSAYDDLIAWRRQLAALRLLDRDPVVEASAMLGSDPARDNYLYQIWLFYELAELLARSDRLEEWHVGAMRLRFRWGEGADAVSYLLKHDQAISHHWSQAPGVRPDLFIARADRHEVKHGDELIWQEPGYVLDAKYYKPRDSARAPSGPVKRMIADLHLTGERHGALLFAFQKDEPPRDSDDIDVLEQVSSATTKGPIYRVTPETAAAQVARPDAAIAVWRVQPAIELPERVRETLTALLDEAHAAQRGRVPVACHGIFLDTLSAAERPKIQGRAGEALGDKHSEVLICPKPHVGPWRVDLVRRDIHCCKDARVCHILAQPDAQPPVRPPRTAQELLRELRDLFDQTSPDTMDDRTAAEVARQVTALTRRFAEISGALKRIHVYEAQLRTYGMRRTLDRLGQPERESLALAVFLVEQINEIGASDFSAPVIHIASVLELEVQRRLLAVPDLTRTAFQHGKPTYGTLGFMRRNPERTGGDWERLTTYLAEHWQGRVDPDAPDHMVTFDDFVQFLNQSKHIRNMAAHTTPVSDGDYERFFRTVCQAGPLRIGALNVLLLAWPM
jgi:hypothetical protein